MTLNAFIFKVLKFRQGSGPSGDGTDGRSLVSSLVRTDGHKFPPLFYRTLSPLGPLPKRGRRGRSRRKGEGKGEEGAGKGQEGETRQKAGEGLGRRRERKGGKTGERTGKWEQIEAQR